MIEHSVQNHDELEESQRYSGANIEFSAKPEGYRLQEVLSYVY
jgi:hypothetical protein